MNNTFRALVGSTVLMLCGLGHATTVQIQTSLGDFEVNLYDQTTPKTVANFLAYVEAGAYDNTLFHRSVSGFVIQAGGYKYNDAFPITSVSTNPLVQNEPVHSNVLGTIAMAKLGGDPNSATSQWFINMGNNSANLDAQNGGFTVFGEIMGSGINVAKAINALPTYKLDELAGFPLRDYNPALNQDLEGENLVMINAVVILDAATDTAANSTPTPNTLIHTQKKKKKSGGIESWCLLALFLFTATTLVKRQRTVRALLSS